MPHFLGPLAEWNRKNTVTSNRENDFGRYDVMLEPREYKEKAFFLKFKVYDAQEESSLRDTVREALGKFNLMIKSEEQDKCRKIPCSLYLQHQG